MLLVSDLNFFLPVIHSFIHSWLIDWYKHIKQVQTVKFSKRKYMAACKKETFSCLNSLISTPQLVQSCSRFRSALWHSVMCFNESMTDISSCDFSYTGQRCFWLFQWWPTILLRFFNSFVYFSLASENPASFPKPCTSLLVHPMWRLLLSQCCVGEARIEAGLSFCHQHCFCWS